MFFLPYFRGNRKSVPGQKCAEVELFYLYKKISALSYEEHWSLQILPCRRKRKGDFLVYNILKLRFQYKKVRLAYASAKEQIFRRICRFRREKRYKGNQMKTRVKFLLYFEEVQFFLCFSFAIAPVYSCFANTYIIVDHTNNTKH